MDTSHVGIIIIMLKQVAIIALAALLLSTLYVSQVEQKGEYEHWKAQFGMEFTKEEDAYRKMVFYNNVAKINAHNADTTQTYTMGINSFTHLTQEEFVKTYLIERPQRATPVIEDDTPIVGADIDWTTKGAISPIKNQGQCGSCWAFSAIATLESFSLMKGGRQILSEQQLVDCSRAQGNAGCNGGYNIQGLAYVKSYGSATSAQYPYVAKDQTCKMTGGAFKIANVQHALGCNAMVNAIALRPIGISVDATNWSPYKSGVFNNCKASINHDVLLAGIGGNGTYWIVKNSWGTSWGLNGYMHLAYGNTCGVCNEQSPWPV